MLKQLCLMVDLLTKISGQLNALTKICEKLDELNADCPEDAKVAACTRLAAFDFDRGLVTAGDTTSYRITDNGTVAATVTHDYTTTFAANSVASYYDPIIAAVNAQPDWTMTLVTDVTAPAQGKPVWQIDYSGPGNGELKIEKAGNVANLGNGDGYVIRVDAAGAMTTAVIENGNEIPDYNSPVYSACA